MANLSKIRRDKMIEFLNKLKEEHTDDESLMALNQIENELTSMRYGLVWEEHEENVDVMMRDNVPVFKEIKKYEIETVQDEKYNFLLEGDNLHSLHLLEKTHKNRVDVIYIDPPYNTGNKDFMYDDVYVDNEDGFRHSKWASFMHKRLSIAQKLLSDNGFIAISIDENEYCVLKMLCDEIFGMSNYLTTFHIQVRYPEKSISTEEKAFKPLMEYVLLYAKNSLRIVVNQKTQDYGLEKFCYRIKEKTTGKKFSVGNQEVIVFKKGEWEIEEIEGCLEGLKETWVTGSIYTTMSYGKVFQTVVEPRVNIDGIGCLYKVMGRGDDGLGYRYYTGPQRVTATKGKMYSGVPSDKADEFRAGRAPQKKIPIVTAIDYAADFGNIRHEGGIPFGSGKKPVKMLKQIINLCSNKDAVVLDFFAGSGSTAQAALELNLEDDGHRTFIMCTNNEADICEKITYPRIKNVIKGYGNIEAIKSNLKYYRTGFISKKDENMAENLLDYIKEMIQLENGVKVDGDKYTIIYTDEEADELEKKWKKYSNLKTIYISRDVLLSTEQEKLFSTVEVCIIPDHYFNFELREAGELW